MNCPTCGAKNEADARFCAECGAPLENPDIEATIVGSSPLRDAGQDEDATVMTSAEEIAAEEAKTVRVDEAQLAAELEKDDDAETAPELKTSPAEASELTAPAPARDDSAGGSGGGTGGNSPVGGNSGGDQNRTKIIIAVVVVVLLLCCCCSIAVGAFVGSDAFEDLMREIALLPGYLPLA